jgi:integrase
MILTAARPSEALKARWSEIDLARKLWTIPAGRMKGAIKHVVPLSAAAVEILERQETVRRSDAVFPGKSGAPLSYNPFAAAVKDAGTPHSWRSIFADACRKRLRVDRDLRERALSHLLSDVEGAYARDTLVEERAPVMEAYARWLLDKGATVIPFPKAG